MTFVCVSRYRAVLAVRYPTEVGLFSKVGRKIEVITYELQGGLIITTDSVGRLSIEDNQKNTNITDNHICCV